MKNFGWLVGELARKRPGKEAELYSDFSFRKKEF